MCNARNMNIINCIKYILILILICEHLNVVNGKKKVKYTVNYSSVVSVCNDPASLSFIDTKGLHPVRVNETTVMLDGYFTMKKEMNNLIKVKVTIEKDLPTGTKEIIMTHEVTDFCRELLERDKDTAQGKALRKVNYPKTCPVPPGNYSVVDMFASTSTMPMNSMMVGVFTLTLTYYQYEKVGTGFLATTKETKLGCIHFDCIIDIE